jgi:acetyl esterase
LPLSPSHRALIDQLSQGPAVETLSASEAREAQRRRRATLAVVPEPIAEVFDSPVPLSAEDVQVRVYRPTADTTPIVVFVHGGGWVLCDLDSHDHLCRRMARLAAVTVVSVGYRLAPEHPFPAALDDVMAVIEWVSTMGATIGGDGSPIAIVGDSAGGNLAAAATIRCRDEGGPPIGAQALVYPVLDGTRSSSSYRDNGEGFYVTANAMRWYWDHYLGRTDPLNPWASPFHAAALSGLPRALIITAELDPLRDEGEAYASRLAEEGVETSCVRFHGMFHGFFSMLTVLPEARRAMSLVVDHLRDH